MTYKSLYAWILTLCLICLSCASTSVPDIKPGQKPEPETDEAGLWMVMDRLEQDLITSGMVESDPALNAYVRQIVCKLEPDICDDIRFYIVNTPHYNAFMAPNGFMQIWTGLMLRAQNEAQLAYVIGHELGHYEERHTLERWRTVRNATAALAILRIASGAAGANSALGDMVTLGALFSLLAYSRHQERESDDIGFDLMADAGYDFHEAANIWEALIEEREASGESEMLILFSTHPATAERVETLREMAAQLASNGIRGESYRDEYQDAIRPFRGKWIKAELRKRDFAASQVVLDHLFNTGDNPCELDFFQGELYRMRAQIKDMEKAIASYQKAMSCEQYPPAALRSLGLMFWKTRKYEDARDSFQNYLVANPAAPDAEMIKSYLEELKKND